MDINLVEDIIDVTYPCLFIDIGTRGRASNDVKVTEILFAVMSHREDELQDDDFYYLDMEDCDDEGFIALAKLKETLRSHCLVSHNVTTDIAFLKMLQESIDYTILPQRINALCTMRYGTRYSTCHIYRGGIKVKKWPTLQQLYCSLFQQSAGKGDICDDLGQCIACFSTMEEIALNAH
jgi:hypothetical protein